MPETTRPDKDLEEFRRTADARDPRATELLQRWDGGGDGREQRVLLGLPYDGGIPSRPGARFGPRALRDALATLGTFDGTDDLRDLVELADLGDLELPTMSAAETHRRVEAAAERLFGRDVRPIFVGGDHGLTGSLVRGFAAARPGARLALVTVDAHLDVREYEDVSLMSSGTPFRRALETDVLAGERTAMIGIRPFANSRYYLDWARERGIHLFDVEDVEARGAAAVAEEALDRVMTDADALYVSIDLDAADVAVAPGVSAMGIGGLHAREMIDLVRTLAAEPHLVGLDLMELSPPHDPDGRTARFAARLLLEALSVTPRRS
jgi:formiminoglutamase